MARGPASNTVELYASRPSAEAEAWLSGNCRSQRSGALDVSRIGRGDDGVIPMTVHARGGVFLGMATRVLTPPFPISRRSDAVSELGGGFTRWPLARGTSDERRADGYVPVPFLTRRWWAPTWGRRGRSGRGTAAAVPFLAVERWFGRQMWSQTAHFGRVHYAGTWRRFPCDRPQGPPVPNSAA